MKSAHVLAVCVVAALVLGSSSFAEAADGAGEYDYTNGPLGQGNWGNLPNSGLCSSGEMQSPMKITLLKTLLDFSLGKLETTVPMGKIPASISNTTKTLEVGLKGLTLKIGAKTFESAQFHIHYPSEHVLYGVEYDMELHLVHIHPATGQIAVIAWFFKLGLPSVFIDQFIDIERPAAGEEKVSIEGGIAFTLTSGKYGRYMGSLTTPPCSENVIWTLNMENIYTLSSTQLGKLQAKFPRNDRDEQNANGRKLRVNELL